MPIKKFDSDLGVIKVSKRRNVKRISLTVASGSIKVTQPFWLPYFHGYRFALSNRVWISQQLQSSFVFSLQDGQQYGKRHVLQITQGGNLACRIISNKIRLSVPEGVDINTQPVFDCFKKGLKRALKKEATDFLPERVAIIANKYNLTYKKLAFKAMRSRWGSCNSKQNISINTYLMLASWDAIDYVIAHELAHTKYMHHKADFWDLLRLIVPDYKNCQTNLKQLQKQISPLQF